MKWQLKKLKEKVVKEADPKTISLFKESLDSFLKKTLITSFHAEEAHDLLDQALPEKEPTERMASIMRSIF